MISHKYKYIFVHIPKCGGSSIEQTLLKAEGVNVQNLDGFYINHLNEGVKKEHLLDYPAHAYSQHYSISQYDSTLSGSYYSFSFVRNPWDLIVSEYFYISDNYDFNFSFNEFVRMGEEIKKIENYVATSTMNCRDILRKVDWLKNNFDTKQSKESKRMAREYRASKSSKTLSFNI